MDASGQARVTFTVSMQPGNNYRAGASCLSDAPDQADQAKADLISLHTGIGEWEGYDVPLVWSKMLTVWRKLHLDLDSMGPGTDPSTLTNRNLDTTALEDVHQGHSWAEINGWTAQQNGRLEGGSLTVTNGGTYEIVDAVQDFGDDTLYVNGYILADEDKPASATDDDAPFVPRGADTSLMNVKYKSAYIEIQLHPEESNFDIQFVANLGNTDTDVVPATASGRSATFLTSNEFWVVQIVTCFQGKDDRDHDPDDIYHFWTGTDFKRSSNAGEVGVQYGQTVDAASGLYDNVSMIFVETIRDRSAWSQIYGLPPFNETTLLNAADVERITVVHEVGHVFGISGDPHPPSGLMKEGVEDHNLEFRAEDLVTIRSSAVVGQQ